MKTRFCKTCLFFVVLASVVALLCSCQKEVVAKDERREITRQMKSWLQAELLEWRVGVRELVERAPVPASGGWSFESDGPAVEGMRRAWRRARDAYERIEGAIAPVFPESDAATDARYDDFLSRLGPAGDSRPFDGEGVIGMHAVERILWPSPALVERFERGLPGYGVPRTPATLEEARAYREELLGRLSADVDSLITMFEPLELDIDFAFQGLIDLAAEQAEKVDRAATGQEESRYAESTMRDLRMNAEGCRQAYEFFRPSLRERGGEALDRRVQLAFERLERAYAEVEGDAIPAPPEGFSGLRPTDAHLRSSFGRLWATVRAEADPNGKEALVPLLYEVADKLELKGVVRR